MRGQALQNNKQGMSPSTTYGAIPHRKMTELVERIGQIIGPAAAGDGVPEVQSDVKMTLRGLLLELIDAALANKTTVSKTLSSVLDLLDLCLKSVPDWVAGDSSAALLHIVDRFGLLLVRCSGSKMLVERAAEVVTLVLETMYPIDAWTFEQCVTRISDTLFHSVCKVSVSLFDGGYRNSGFLNIGRGNVSTSVSSPSGKHVPDSVAIDSKGCETVIFGILNTCSRLARKFSFVSVQYARHNLFSYAVDLLSSQSAMVHSASVDFIEVHLRSSVVCEADCRILLNQLRRLMIDKSSSYESERSDNILSHEKMATIFWSLWNALDDVSDGSLKIEVLRVLELLLLSRVKTFRHVWIRLFCECFVDAPDVGMQCSLVFRNLGTFDAQEHRMLLAVALTAIPMYPQQEVENFVRFVYPIVSESMSESIHLRGSNKKRKISGISPGKRSEDSQASQKLSNQFASPSLNRMIKGILLSLHKDMDKIEDVIRTSSADEGKSLFDKIVATLGFVAQLSRETASELCTAMLEKCKSGERICDAFLLEMAVMLFDLSASYSLTLQGLCVDRYGLARKTGRGTINLEVLFAAFYPQDIPSDFEVSLDSRMIDFAHFLPLVSFTVAFNSKPRVTRDASKKGRNKHNVICIQEDHVSFIIGLCRKSEDICRQILVGIMIYLLKWPDVDAMFDMAREVFLTTEFHSLELHEHLDSYGNLQPKDSRAFSQILYELSQAYHNVDDIAALIVHAAIIAFHRASATDSKEWRGLAEYLIGSVQSRGLRSQAFQSGISVLKCENFVLALTLEKDHPINSKDRSSASILGENEVVKALQAQLPSSVEKAFVFENVLAALSYCSSAMKNVNAVNLSMVVLIFHLVSKDLVINALTAQCLFGIANIKGRMLKDLLLQNLPLLEILGPRLPTKTDMLVELADLLDMSTKSLLSACMSTILPAICDKGGIAEIKALSRQVSMTPKQLLLRYGQYPLTASFMTETPSMEKLLKIFSNIMQDDFDTFASAITARTLLELVLQTGAHPSWNSCQGMLPDSLMDRTSKSIGLLIIKLRDIDIDSVGDIASLLADGDHVTRLLKHLGDMFDEMVAQGGEMQSNSFQSPLKIVRGVIFLIKVTGKYVGRFLPQFLVLLSASIRTTIPADVRVQGLIGWAYLIQSLASFAPLQLGSSSNQIVVALLDCLQEDGSVGTAALKALEVLIDACKRMFPEKLHSLPPIPQCSPELKALSNSLMDLTQISSINEKVKSLLDGLKDEALNVRVVTLRELKNIFCTQRHWLSTLTNPSKASESDDLLKDLISALIKSSDPEITSISSITAQQVCAECLGMLGALDPSRVRINTTFESSRYRDLIDLAGDIMTNHLIKLLMTAHSMSVLDRITVAIQDVLRCDAFNERGGQNGKKGNASNSAGSGNVFFDSLPEEVQALVRPYLDSKYTFTPKVNCERYIYEKNMRLRTWIGLWLVKMINSSGETREVSFFRATASVLMFDVPTAMALAPYIVLAHLEHAGSKAREDIVGEILHVIDQNQVPTKDGISCMQSIFSLLDVLRLWLQDGKMALSQSTAIKGEEILVGFDWKILEDMIEDIPRIRLAMAASKCGAHARALLYYETHLRLSGGKGANIAAASSTKFSDDEVTFLLGLYSKLEEPDALGGVMKLRQGTSTLEDQRLAAEKNGSWGEASSLYELEISSKASSMDSRPELMDGYLNCLLQMGHWEGLAGQVRGLLLSKGSKPTLQHSRMAPKGAAALWRLGKFDGEIIDYIKMSGLILDKLTLDEKWELRVSKLLCYLSDISRNSDSSLYDKVSKELSSMRHEIMPQFSAAAKESYARAYPYLVKLHMIQEISDATDSIRNSYGPKERQRFLRWNERISVTQPTISSRGPILDLRRQLGTLMHSDDEVGICWIENARLCRETGHLEAAGTSAVKARTLGVPGSSLEQLEILNAKGNTHRALHELQGLLPLIKENDNHCENFSSKKEKVQYISQILLREAQWTAEMGQGTREEVVNLFEQALSTRTDHSNWESGFYAYALYLDQYMLDAKARQANLERRDAKVSDRLGGKSKVKFVQDRPYYSYYPELIKTYGKCVLAGSRHIYQTLPRLLTLWFELGTEASKLAGSSTVSIEVQEEVMAIMKDLSRKIPMHCWMTALPQLISRICHNHPDVSGLTRLIITDAAIMYPQQVLWALAGVSKSGRSNRRSAATSIINGAKRRSKEQQKRLFSENNVLCEQLYKLCHFSPPDGAKVISAKKSFSHLYRVMPLGVIMPTLHSLTFFQALDHGQEKNITSLNESLVTIEGMQDQINIMTSLMKPKRIVFIGSDGKDYPFLAKPKDDLRKDNRMMEAAGVINRLFKDDPDARQRDLYLRRFAVIAITEDCGLVEWVSSTKPVRSCISEVFVDSPSQLRMINQEIKKLYDSAATMNDGRSKGMNLMKWLDAVLSTYPPCFHKWFLKHYPEPASWLNARIAFTRTYSVWCVVGHVVGLGDRHLENVLLDMSSGDAVQIDFGCLFDKGLTLPQPEVVPFRLTQNIIDAFGVSGVEGMYRHSFENTLSILRKHRGNIVSIMETFVHDPLVDWAKSEDRRSTSKGDKEADNPQARDWLDTITGRLQGTLLGVTSEPCMPLSVQGQTQRLIQEATSMENLSRMYIWWQAWY